MKKADFIALFASNLSTSKAEAGRILDVTLKSIQEALKKAGKLPLIGFGTFKTTKVPAMTIRNPQTGRPMDVSARIRVSFSAGSKLKGYVNGSRMPAKAKSK
ncbi:DNA-binding protein HU-beta [Alphaproteobacteria bacterium]